MFYQLEACFLAGDSEEEISARKFPIPTLGQPVHTKEDIKWYAEENDNKNPKQMRIIQSDSEYESVMPQTQLEKEKQQQNSRKGKI